MPARIGVRDEVSVKRECDIPEGASTKTSEVAIDGLECNICLESACEPVVTLCGHLYCWPCIYKWLHVQESYVESHQEPRCPICKANISCGTLVPLYGRDDSTSVSRAGELDLHIPNRPAFTPQNFHRLTQQSSRGQHPNLSLPSSLPIDSDALAVLLDPLTCKFGEMVYARIFGASGSDTQSYTNLQTSSNNPRMRHQEKKLEMSLNRLSFFFFCCVLLCLFLF